MCSVLVRSFFLALDGMFRQGRMKFTRPLYRELFALDGDTRVTAVNTFKERASFYHPICRSMVAKDMMVELGERDGTSGSGGGGSATWVRFSNHGLNVSVLPLLRRVACDPLW